MPVRTNAIVGGGGSSGGGGGVTNETCEVTIRDNRSTSYITNVAYTSVDSSGKVIGVNQTVSTASVTITCIKGSVLTVKYNSYINITITSTTNASLLFHASTVGVYQLDDDATTATIKITSGSVGGV